MKKHDLPIDFSSLSPSEMETVFTKVTTEKDNEIEALRTKLNWFEEQFKLLKHQRYAQSSEKHTALQLSFFDENDEELQSESSNQAKETITYTRKKPNRNTINVDTSQLPREKHIIDLIDDEKQCSCGNCLEKFGEDIREELVFIPSSLKVVEHIRYKYTCRQCKTVTMPKALELPLSKSKAGASLLSVIILNKYRYHLPFYRQAKMFVSHKITIPDNTIAGWVMKAAEKLEPLHDAFWQELSTVSVLQVDETPVKILKPEKKAYMWLYHCYMPGKKFVLFDFSLNRSAAVVNSRLENFKGLLQTDGYSGYATQRKRSNIISMGCWDHSRRKFADVVKACGNNKSGKAGKMLEKIAKLYAIEKNIRELPFDQRKLIRQKESKPKLEAIHEFLQKINAPPKSLLGIAVTYAKNQWQELIRYVDHGEAEISNCWIENQVRPFAIGKRNWLFVGNEVSASRAALLYSLIQSCELNKIEPRPYLEYVLKQVHRMRRGEVDPVALLPHKIDQSLLKD